MNYHDQIHDNVQHVRLIQCLLLMVDAHVQMIQYKHLDVAKYIK